jgi:D-serine deaminase-like pyridoxal phosphate-dependent protein
VTEPRIPDEYIDWRTKGFLHTGPPVSLRDFAAARHGLFDGDFAWPLMVARRTAIERNVAVLARFCERHGLVFAPHGKTTMAPRLIAAQLDAGAWAVTAATVGQVRAYRAFGVSRVLLANELVDPGGLRWVLEELAADPDFDFLCYVDSIAGVAALAEALGARPALDRPLRVLVEIGYDGGRTGARELATALAVAAAANGVDGLSVAGVAGYEGGLPDLAAVRGFLSRLREAAVALAEAGLLGDEGPALLSVGGSAWFDAVAELAAECREQRPLGACELRVVLRSGAYIAHDEGVYLHSTPFNRISATAPAADGADDTDGADADDGDGGLEPALEVWAQVTSAPEPGLAILAVGKREINYDEGLPVPTLVRRDGATRPLVGVTVRRLNDHHAYLDVPPEADLAVGDLVRLGISHPCTAFDRWQVIPVAEPDDTVTDLIRTYF